MKSKKIISTLLSIVMSFLIILIVALFSRSMVSNILPEDSKISIFINDYLNMMVRKIDMVALKLNVKRNTVTQYQVDLITQSIEDYVNYSVYQTSDVVSGFDVSKQPNSKELDKYKNDYYKMTLENPYLKSLTVFNMSGGMLLNLYLSGNKSWPYEIENTLVSTVSKDGYIVLNASNENSFYVFQHVKNKSGEFIVATRNDYVFVSDIANYYQVADKTFYVSDSRNDVYAVVDGSSPKSIENATSIINKFAFYKKQPSFSVGKNNALSVALIGLEYPNYFEFIVLVITALCIVIIKCFLQLIISFFKYIFFGKKGDVSLPKDNVPLIDEEAIIGKKPASNNSIPPLVSVKEEISLDDRNIGKELKSNLNIDDNKISSKLSDDDIHAIDLVIADDLEEIINTNKVVITESNKLNNYSNQNNSLEVKIENRKDDNVIVVNNLGDIEEESHKDDTLANDDSKPKSNEELFQAFDNMLASIISKVENEARDSLTKRN